jgi:uncharacterized coiled-coil protein SlyX
MDDNMETQSIELNPTESPALDVQADSVPMNDEVPTTKKPKRANRFKHVSQKLKEAQTAISKTKTQQTKITTSLPRFQKRLERAQKRVKLWSAKSCSNKSSEETKALASTRLAKATADVALMMKRIDAANSRLTHVKKVVSQRDKRVDGLKTKLKESKDKTHHAADSTAGTGGRGRGRGRGSEASRGRGSTGRGGRGGRGRGHVVNVPAATTVVAQGTTAIGNWTTV